MSDIFNDFDKKNEFPKIKLDINNKSKVIEEMTDKILNYKQFDFVYDKIVEDIKEQKDNVKAMEFTKNIGELLIKNGVKVKMTEYTRDFENGNTLKQDME